MSWITDQNLDPALQDWGEAYKDLCAIIKAKLPEIKHIDLYYGQDQVVDQDGNWVPFRAPAIFLEFQAAQVKDLGDNTQELMMDITMYLCMETVQDTNHGSAGQRRALEFVGLLRKMHMVMHGAEGDHFSPLSRVALAKKADAPPYMYMYGQTYRCVLLDNSTSKQYDFLAAGTLGLEIEPYSAPPVTDDRLVVVRNTDNTYSVEVTAPGEHLLPNVIHMDSNGAPKELPAMTPMVCTPAGSGLPGRAILYNSNGDELDSAEVPAGEEVPMSAPDLLVMSSSGLIPVALRPSGDVWALPPILLRYYRDGALYAMPAIGVAGNDSTLELEGYAFQSRPLRNSQGLDLGIEVALDDLVNSTVPRVPSARIQRRNGAGEAIGEPISVPPGPEVDVECPDATVRSADTSPLFEAAVHSNQGLTLPPVRIMRGNGTEQDVEYRPLNTSPVFTEVNELEFHFDLADGQTLPVTIRATTAGTYTVLTSDGASGTITFSKNGGAFVAIGAGITLAAGETIRARRTVTSASGWVRLTTA